MDPHRRRQRPNPLAPRPLVPATSPDERAIGSDNCRNWQVIRFAHECRARVIASTLWVGVALTYWIAPGRRIVLLTVFVKTRMVERREVVRALGAMRRCDAERHVLEEGDDVGA